MCFGRNEMQKIITGLHVIIWHHSCNCLLSSLSTKDVKMIAKWTTYYIQSSENSPNKIIFHTKNHSQKKHFRKPIQKTVDSLYVVVVSGCFIKISGTNHGRELNGATQLQQSKTKMQENCFSQFFFPRSKPNILQTAQGRLLVDHGLPDDPENKIKQSVLIKFTVFPSFEKQLLINQCKQKQTEVPTIFLLSPKIPDSADFQLSGNRSYSFRKMATYHGFITVFSIINLFTP